MLFEFFESVKRFRQDVESYTLYDAPQIDIPFKDTDPQVFEEYLGQDNIKRRIELRINAMADNPNGLKMLLSAPAGLGKTAFARVVANEMAERNLINHYYEIVAGKIETKSQLDQFIVNVRGNSFVFIDEIHGLQGLSRDALLPVLQDNVYAFDKHGLTMQPLPENVSWVGATTDVGKVHPALQRRLSLMVLEPMGIEDRMVLALSLPFPMTERAAEIIARRCWTPWEVKDEAYAVAKDLAINKELAYITAGIAEEALAILGVDANGLKSQERNVLTALHNSKTEVAGKIKYRMSGRALMSVTGLDSGTLYDKVEPKLMACGYLRVGSSGRELTDKALAMYFNGD